MFSMYFMEFFCISFLSYGKYHMYTSRFRIGHVYHNIEIHPAPLLVRCDVVDLEKNLATVTQFFL